MYLKLALVSTYCFSLYELTMMFTSNYPTFHAVFFGIQVTFFFATTFFGVKDNV